MMKYPIHYQSLEAQLSFENKVFPRAIINQNGFTTVAECQSWIKANLSKFEKQLAQSGALLFRGFPVSSADSFDEFSLAFDYPSFTYQESLSNAVRINYTDRVFTANEAPKDVEIYLHHEMAQTPISPDKLFFFCKRAAEHGGATPLCRSDQLYQALINTAPDLAQDFLNKGVKYTTLMPAQDNHTSGQGRSWKSTLSVKSTAQAEQKLAKLGYSWHWQDNGDLTAITPVLDAVRQLDNGTPVFYNQLLAAYLGWQGVKENPSKAITYGDGSPISISTLDLIVSLSKQFTYDIQWQDGDVALIDNKITMHGRRPFSGNRKRQVLVALAA